MSSLLLPNPDSPFDLLLNPHNPLRPAEWAPIPEELLFVIAPQGALVQTPESKAAINRIALGEWFLIRNFDGAHCESCRPGGRYSKSRILGAVHTHVTIECVESPFNGLRQILWWMEDVDRRNGYRSGTMLERFAEHCAFRPPDWTFEILSPKRARYYNDQIRQRGGQPVIDQCPPRPQDLDATLIRRRIANRARAWRMYEQAA